jgi:hypothetical protein
MTDRYLALQLLHAGGVLELSGIRPRKRTGEIQPGDLYVGERNTGPKLLTCKEVRFAAGVPDFVVPTTANYAYDWSECVRVEEALPSAGALGSLHEIETGTDLEPPLH